MAAICGFWFCRCIQRLHHGDDSLVQATMGLIRLMDKILHYLKDPKLWELWYIPYYGSCRILSINRNNDSAVVRKSSA